MALGELADDPQQPLLDRGGVQGGEQHDERALVSRCRTWATTPGQSVSISSGWAVASASANAGMSRGPVVAGDAGAHAAVEREQLDAVARPGGQRREQQRGLDRRVDPRARRARAPRTCGRCRAR